MNDKFLTQNEAAQILGVSVKTLQILRRNRKLAFARLGHRTIRYRESQIQEFVRRRERAIERVEIEL